MITKTSSCQWFHSHPSNHHHTCPLCYDDHHRDHHQKDNHQSGRVLVLSCDAASIQRTETSSASLQFQRYPGNQDYKYHHFKILQCHGYPGNHDYSIIISRSCSLMDTLAIMIIRRMGRRISKQYHSAV